MTGPSTVGAVARCARCLRLAGLAALMAAYHVAAASYDLAPNARDCFYTDAQPSEIVAGSYETFLGDEALRVSVESTKTPVQVLYQSTGEADNFKVEVKEAGAYALCFRNLLSYEQIVTFNVRVLKHDQDHRLEDLATQDDSNRIVIMAEDLLAKVGEVRDQQSHAVARESFHRDTTESTNSRVLWWTLLQLATLVALSAFQLYYMRSFFEVKTII
eukprot:GHVT01045243.1.p1 GENE.GHVT01045243.1~~GHVT01045243.1.p1  ORF type:complete len:216 (+),score=48.22 GHVT01045243.1:638-1285(+)